MDKKRYLLIFVILMLFFISISSVNAGGLNITEDLTINEEIAIDNGDSIYLSNEELTIQDNDILTSDGELNEIELSDNFNEKEVLSDSNSITVTNKTFSGIQTAVNDSDMGYTIILDGTYLIDGNRGISVNKQLSFIGINNATLDAKNLGPIFTLGTSGVSFKDITFKNGRSIKGGAFFCEWDGVFVNCSFVNNSAREGGAVYNMIGECSFVNCSFVNNSCMDFGKSGGAVYTRVECSFVNCSFVNNSASSDGGAICGDYSSSASIINCSFVNNSASSDGGAVFIAGGSVVNCSFVNNSASSDGGAVYSYDLVLSIDNCSFVNNSASSSGALYVTNDFEILNCSFENNTADIDPNSHPILKLYSFSFVLGDDGILIANLSDVGGPLSYCELTFTVSGLNYNLTTDANGLAYLNVTNILTEVGNYTAEVNFAGDEGYSSVSTTGTVNVHQYYCSTLILNDLSFFNGEDGLLVANLSDSRGPLANRLITFTVYGEDINVTTNVSGLASINLKNYLTSYGTYSVNASFAGDDYDTATFDAATVNVIRDTSILSVNDLSFFNGGDGLLVANLSDSRGPLANRLITFTVYGEDINVTTNVSGLASINLKNYLTSYGTYSVNASFAGDDYDTATFDAATVNVIRDTSILSVNNLTVFINNDGYLNATLSDSRGPLANHVLNFLIGRANINQTTDSKGVVRINVKPFLTKSGEYTVVISFAGDDFDTSVSTNATVKIDKYDPTLTVNNLSGVLGDDYNLIATLSDSRGILSSKTITFTVNGQVITQDTNNKGSVTLNVKDYLPTIGEHTVTVSFAGDDYDNEVSTNATVIINKYAPFLSVNDLSVYLGDDAILKADLYNRNGPLSGKNVTFVINGTNITKSTISSGIASLNIKPYLTDLGEYNIGVIFEGDDFNHPISTNAIVNVYSYIATLSVSQVGKYYNGSCLRLNLTDNKTNIGISGANIELIFSNGNSTILTTDSEGIASFDIPFVPGLYAVNANVIDSNVLVNAATLNGFEIKSRVGVIEITQRGMEYNNSSLAIKLYDDITGDVYKNVKVDLDFIDLGETAEVITDEDGIAVYDIPFGIGVYYVYVSVNEEYAEFDSAQKDDIIITRSNSVITFEEDIGFVVGGSGSTNFIVIGGTVNEGNISVVGHSEANIKLVGNEITVSELDVGNYTLKVTTTPDSNHKSVTAYLNVTVYDSTPSIVLFDDNIVFDYGNSGSASFTVVGGSVDLENISVVGHPEAVISLNGNVVTVSNLTVGEYTLEMVTTPDFRHSSAVSHVGITVNMADSYIEFTNDIVFDWGGFGTTTLILNGCTVNPENISVLGHSEAIITLSGSKVNVSNLAAGSYILNVVSTPDSNYNSINMTCPISVNKIPSTISFADVKFEYLGTGSTFLILSGCVVDEENVRVIGSNGTLFSNVVSLNGNILNIFNLPIDVYSLVITTTPDGNHTAVTGDASITVTEMASNVIFNNDVSVDVGNVAVLNLTVVGGTIDIDSLSISGQSPTFEIETVGDDYLVYISNLPVGTHTLKVTTIPDSLYYSVSKYCVINVKDPRTNTSISWGSKSMKFTYGGSGSVNVAVTGGTLSANNIVVVGHKEAVIKYSSGKITVSNLTVGTYTLKVTPTADANHIAKPQNITITVTKIPAVITAKAITVYYKNTKKWSIKLINNSTKKALAGKYIVLKVYTGKKYKTYKVKTNSKGIATFSVPKTLKLGTHKVVLSYSASNTNCKSVTSKIVVKKQVLSINIGFQKFTDGSRTIDIIVKDKATKKALNKIKVKVMIYTGSKVTKTYTKLVTAYYKHNKENGFAMYGGGIKAFGKAGTHKIVVKPVDTKYSGKSNTIKISVPKSAKSIKTFVVSSGKVSTLK